MDILTMNKQWIHASHIEASRCRKSPWIADGLNILEYLDTMGLFETGWMIYDFNTYHDEKRKYGYPNNE